MRLQILILIAVLMTGCLTQPHQFGYRDVSSYRPKPSVAISAFTENDSVVMAYVRHSEGGVLLRLAPAGMSYEISKKDVDRDVHLDSSEDVVFNSGSYEDFDQSYDLYRDGRIVLVPLPEKNGRAVGAFVNLLSGKRYFFAPAITSPESLAAVRTINHRWDITVVVPEDRRAHERLGLFPEFQR